MNKKLTFALIVPLMLVPLASFAYAHFYGYVAKRYAIHVGSVEVAPIYFHIDELRMIDVDNDGVIIGDEFNYTIHQDAATGKWYVDIVADPIPSGFVLNTTLKIHITGKLPVRFNFGEAPYGGSWAGPFVNWTTFPAWDDPLIKWHPGLSTLPGVSNPIEGPWSYEMRVYKENATGVFGPVGSTEEEYKPSNNITIIQHLDFRQPGQIVGETWTPKDWMCKRILIRFEFQFIEEYPSVFSSETWMNPNWPPSPPGIPTYPP